MKIDLKTIPKLGVSPNGIYVLFLLKRGIEPSLIDTEREIAFLVSNGYLSSDKLLTKLGEAILAQAQYLCKTKKEKIKLTEDDLPFIEKYRMLWPPGFLPNGTPGRSSVRDLKERFETFFGQYNLQLEWGLVLQAAALYLDEAEKRSYEYTQNSENFIYRTDKFKNTTSSLEKYCQLIKDGVDNGGLDIVPSIINIPGL
jgi:hypothetical protein